MILFFCFIQAFACKTENEFDDLIGKLKQVKKIYFYFKYKYIFHQNLPLRPMFEICETNPFDSLSKNADEHEGK